VVGVTATVVSDGRSDVIRHLIDAAEELFHGQVLKILVTLQSGVQVAYVRRVMLSVVDLHRPRVDGRLERVKRVRQIGECVLAH
jgi:hypothetical protein